MQLLSLEFIRERIPFHALLNETSLTEEHLTELFFDNLTSATGKTMAELYPDIIHGYLHNSFELKHCNSRPSTVHVKKYYDRHILLEKDLLFRFISQFDLIVYLTDRILGKSSRFEGIAYCLDLFRDRPLFQYLEYLKADIYEKTFLMETIRSGMADIHRKMLFDMARFLPASVKAKLIHAALQGQTAIEKGNLVRFDTEECNYYLVRIQPFLPDLLKQQ